jgi:hypothetical protein
LLISNASFSYKFFYVTIFYWILFILLLWSFIYLSNPTFLFFIFYCISKNSSSESCVYNIKHNKICIFLLSFHNRIFIFLVLIRIQRYRDLLWIIKNLIIYTTEILRQYFHYCQFHFYIHFQIVALIPLEKNIKE